MPCTHDRFVSDFGILSLKKNILFNILSTKWFMMQTLPPAPNNQLYAKSLLDYIWYHYSNTFVRVGHVSDYELGPSLRGGISSAK